MSWLEDRLAKLTPFRRGGTAVAEREGTAAGAAVPEKGNPPLMLLVNDASGRASFKTHVFDSAESATDFVLYWFPNQSQGGIIAFWAMTQEPQFGLDSLSETVAEALVMIRDVKRDGVVYLFSFVDMDSARAFLREEVRHGTDFSLMMLYWAVPVRLTADPWGRMMLTPSTPPGTEPDIETEAPVSDTWSPPQAPPVFETDGADPAEEPRDVFEEAPNARTGVADPMGGIDETFELTSWMDRPRKKSLKRTDAEAETTRAMKRRALERRLAGEQEFSPAPEAFETVVEPAPAQAEPIAADKHTEAPAEPEAFETFGDPEPAKAEPAAADEHAVAPIEPEAFETLVEPEPAQVEFVGADEHTETEAEAEPEAAPGQSADAPPEAEPATENATGESAPEPAPEVAPAEVDATPDALEADVLQEKMRARTNGNGHKPLPANGHGNNAVTSNHIVAEVHVNGDTGRITFPIQEAVPPADEQAAEITLGAQVPEATVEPEASGNGHVDESIEIRIDIQLQSSRALKVKRWEVKEEPFEGFNSPPGRF